MTFATRRCPRGSPRCAKCDWRKSFSNSPRSSVMSIGSGRRSRRRGFNCDRLQSSVVELNVRADTRHTLRRTGWRIHAIPNPNYKSAIHFSKLGLSILQATILCFDARNAMRKLLLLKIILHLHGENSPIITYYSVVFTISGDLRVDLFRNRTWYSFVTHESRILGIERAFLILI